MDTGEMGSTLSRSPGRNTHGGKTRRVQCVGPDNRYVLGETLGKGAYGYVVKAFDRQTEEYVAIKFMTRGRNLDPVYAKREILNHRSLHHSHVVTFRKVFLTNRSLCIVMELADGGTLAKYVEGHKCLSEEWARWYFQQLIVATDYCHNMGVVMRDIKLNNLLLNKEQTLIKICDFGFSKHIWRHTRPNTQLGTAAYIAPEILVSKEYDGQKADIWTCGVALFHMVYGCPPVDMQRREGRESTRDTLLRVTSEPIEIPAYQERCGQQCQISEGCQDLLRRLLTKDPEARIPLSQIKEHSWFTVCLPEGIHEYNTTLQNQQGSSESSTKHLQSVEWIENLIDMAASSRNQ